jgi:putative oxygen-independent coproporphyrinogen III oxidase
VTSVDGAFAGARHLYVHLPFCAHRCGYCDFVTVVGSENQHAAYVDALIRELHLERARLAEPLETIFLGGGTPSFTRFDALARLLSALPPAREVTVEANPETVTPDLARLLRREAVTRVSLGAQSFSPRLLAVLERRAGPDDVRAAVHTLRDVGFDNISLDLLYGIPGQGPAALERDLAEALSLFPEHLSCYELEAKAGTRFAYRFGSELDCQAEAMEGYLERIVETLTAAGYRWYETANFCRVAERSGGRDLRAHHNLAYWQGRDYLGLGVGAVSTVAGQRWRNAASVPRYLAALAAGRRPTRELEVLDASTRTRERLMLALRLDAPVPLDSVRGAVDATALERLRRLGLVERESARHAERELRLTHRGRMLGDGVTVELLA